MDNLLAARAQIAFTLGFHIIFASIGIAMPFLMAAAHYLHLKRKDETYRLLTKAWSRGVAIFFAVGAVSGTALSFELGLLWPKFMNIAGPIIGLPFALEGAAFFLEAIALGIFLYGWDRMAPWAHWWSGVVIGVSGVASAFFVISANSWMNNPAGFTWNGGNPTDIDPLAAMFNRGAFLQGLHMVVAAFQAVGFAVAGLHALLYMYRRADLHTRAMTIAFIFGAVASLVQPLIGDMTAKMTAERQPLKLAAMEAQFETAAYAPLRIGGIPDVARKEVRYAIEIPGLLSFLAYGRFDAVVKGLNSFARGDWPSVAVVHYAFQLMVGAGMLLAGVGIAGLFLLWKRAQAFLSRPFLIASALCVPLGFAAIEAGWIVTEVGRQPWIIHELMRTSEAVTPRPGVIFTLGLYAVLYAILTLAVTLLMFRQVKALHRALEEKGL